MNNQEKFNTQIQNSTKIAVCTDEVVTLDQAYSLAVVAKYLQSIGKEVSVIVAQKLSPDYSNFFVSRNLEITHEAKPLSYVISIDYGSTGLDKVTYDTNEESGVLKFYIVPNTGVFDFENVEYSTEGKAHDLTVTLGITSFKDMGEVYDNSSYLFKENKVISIAKGIDSLGDTFIKVDDENLLLLGMYSAIREQKPSEEIVNLVLEGMFQMHNVLEGGESNAVWNTIGMLAGDGGNIDQAMRDTYFSKSYQNLDLQIKLMHNIKVAKDVGVIWSTVSNEDLKFCGLDKDTLDLKGRIPFNVSGEFDLAIAAYEIVKDSVRVIVESNNTDKYSAIQIANVFDGNGNDSHAEFVIEDMPIKAFSKRFFTVLSDMYDTQVEGKGIEFRTTHPSDQN